MKVIIHGTGKQRTEELYKDGELFLKVFYDGDTRLREEVWSNGTHPSPEELPVKRTSFLPLLLAFRYFLPAGGIGKRLHAASILGIAVGVMTLTVVLAVMNGFQLGFIESIVEISSYHLQCSPSSARPPRNSRVRGTTPELDSAAAARVRGVPGVTAVVPFVQRQALVEGAFQRPRVCAVRAVPPDLFQRDPVQARMLAPSRAPSTSAAAGHRGGSRACRGSGGACRGRAVLTSYSAGAAGGRFPAATLHPHRDVPHRLLRLRLRLLPSYPWRPRTPSTEAAAACRAHGASRSPTVSTTPARCGTCRPSSRARGFTVGSWRSYNRSFFDALFVEKLMMMVLVGLIFFVVGFNVFHSLRRSVHERMEEIAVLKAVGVPPRRIRTTFILQGLFIGTTGGAAGLLLGLALSMNMNEVFSAVEGRERGHGDRARDGALVLRREAAETGFPSSLRPTST